MLSTLLISALTLFPAGSRDEPDVLRLQGGKTIECRVLYEDSTRIVYRAKGKSAEIGRSEVAAVESVENSLRTYLRKYDESDRGNPRAQAELAQWAESNGLPGEAQCGWIRILNLEPLNELAWAKLGGVKQRDVWKLKVRGRFYSIEELRKRVSDWKTALELPTAHFLVRSDGDPARLLDAAIDVERAWLAFYDVFGTALTLYVFDETPELNFVTDPKDYPSPPVPGMSVWFDRVANSLNCNLTENPNRTAIASEFCELMIFNAFRRTLDKRTGDIEGWVRSGIAMTFGFGFRPDPGHATFDFKVPEVGQFRLVAEDKDPLPLKRILGSGRGAYDGGPGSERYVAAAYTLVHFLAFGDEGKHRAQFGEYMRDAYIGKSGASRLYEKLGLDEKALESAWREYVKRTAGG
ncbi:MAG: hypothetical protein NTY35_02655 [Planctomycetota bacterium]|nr:hypothetical protein [Planctomycetota bacterium]